MMQDSFTYQDWEYGFTNGAFYAVPSKGRGKPKELIKFFALKNHNLNALEEPYLYCPAKFELNDIFDDGFNLLNFSNSDAKLLLEFIEKELKSLFNWDYLREAINIIKTTEDPLEKDTYARLILKIFYERNNGFISFSGIKNIYNSAMWGHYSQNKGFCVVYNTNELLKNKKITNVLPINYVEKIEEIIFDSKIYHIQLLSLHLIKEKCWIYEDEWRAFIYSPDDNFNSPYFEKKEDDGLFENRKIKLKDDSSNAIEKIILGPETFPLACSRIEKSLNNNIISEIFDFNEIKDSWMTRNYKEYIISEKNTVNHKDNICRLLEILQKKLSNTDIKVYRAMLQKKDGISLAFYQLESIENEGKYKFKINYYKKSTWE